MSRCSFQILAYRLPFRRPVSFGQGEPEAERYGHLIRLLDSDGAEGWGETAPLPGFNRETFQQAMHDLHVGGMIWKSGLPEPTRHMRWPSSRAGLEQAIRSLAAAREGRPPHQMLRPDAPSRLPVAALLQGDISEHVQQGLKACVNGCRTVKIKVGRRPVEIEAELVRQLHEALGHAVRIRLDANRAWSLGDAVKFARLIDGLQIEYVEEPVSHPGALKAFHDGSGLPVALDETLNELKPEQWTHLPGIEAVVLKPTVLGGAEACGQLARMAAHHGIRAVVSSCYESGVGTLGLIALAAAVQTASDAAGLDPYLWLASDVLVSPLALMAGDVDVSPVARTEVRMEGLIEVSHG